MLYQGSGRGDIARMLREGGGGEIVANGDCEALQQTILRWADDRDLTRRLGQQARGVFEANYTKAIGLGRYQQILEQ